MMRLGVTFLVVLALGTILACGPRGREEPPALDEPQEPASLETQTLGDEEIVPLEEPPSGAELGVTEFRPCGWSRRWEGPGKKPVLVGGGVAEPKRISGSALKLPPREGTAGGFPVLELVIDERGHVEQVHFVQSFEPPWPEGEAAIVEGVGEWRYEPAHLKGEPVPVCVSVTVSVRN